MKLVSVVIPAYNNEKHIAETLKSITSQTYTNLEIIVADHSSTDGTLEIINTFTSDPRIRVVSTETGGGAPRNWNRVSELANGSFVKLVCGDDVIMADCISRQVGALERFPSAGMAASPRQIIDENGKILYGARGLSGLSGLIPGRRAIRATVRAGSNIFGEPACVTFRKEALAEAGWWDPNAEYLLDQVTYCRVLLNHDLVAIPEVLAKFRVSNSQWSFRLVALQAAQVCMFHRTLRSNWPEIITALDLLRGNFMARANAFARRIIYRVLESR